MILFKVDVIYNNYVCESFILFIVSIGFALDAICLRRLLMSAVRPYIHQSVISPMCIKFNDASFPMAPWDPSMCTNTLLTYSLEVFYNRKLFARQLISCSLFFTRCLFYSAIKFEWHPFARSGSDRGDVETFALFNESLLKSWRRRYTYTLPTTLSNHSYHDFAFHGHTAQRKHVLHRHYEWLRRDFIKTAALLTPPESYIPT